MALDSLLATLKSGVAEVTEVQASRNRTFACNPTRFARITEVAGVAAETHTVTPAGKSEVAAQSAPIEACTHETSVTPKTIKCEVSVTEGKPCGTGDTATASRWWLIHYPDRDPVEVACCPEATHADILERYPDALAAEPERPRRTPTEAEAKELLALVQAIGAAEKWPADETEWATEGALADPDGALIYYRALAVKHGIILPLDDDRRTCSQCANLNGRRCLAAWRAEIVANRNYEPIRDILHRCEGYMPGPDDPDRRSGNERWPGLTAKDGDHE